jgi:hypothetical protein
MGKLRQLLATARRHRPTAVSEPPGGGVVSPFTSFQGIFSILRLPFFRCILLGVIKILIQLKVIFVVFGLAGN